MLDVPQTSEHSLNREQGEQDFQMIDLVRTSQHYRSGFAILSIVVYATRHGALKLAQALGAPVVAGLADQAAGDAAAMINTQ